MNKRSHKERDILDSFAQSLADGKSPAAAAKKLGYKPSFGAVLLKRLEDRLGSQAR